MESPLMTLPCLSAQLELYANHVMIRPIGAWSWVAKIVEETIPINTIESVRLMKSNPKLTGVIQIIRRETQPRSVFVLFAHDHAKEASALYETLDDLVTRRDVLSVIRSSEST